MNIGRWPRVYAGTLMRRLWRSGWLALVLPSLAVAQSRPAVAAPPVTLAAVPSAVPAVAPAMSPTTVTAFVDVTVLPMDRERLLPHHTVVVRGEQIVALGPTKRVRIPAGATRVDGRGKFLLPGLADMHAHNDDTTLVGIERWLYAQVANGVTTVRIMGAPALAAQVLAARTRVARGELVGPRLYVAAGPLDSAAQVVAAKDSGYDLVKLYGVDGPALDSLAATAHRLGLPIAGHTPSYGSLSYDTASAGLQRAIDVGYASTEHLTGFDALLGNPGYWSPRPTAAETYKMLADTAKLQAMATALARANVWTCPTLAMFDATLRAPPDTWPEIRYLRPKIRHGVEANAKQWKAPDSALVAMIEVRRAIVRALQEAKAGMLLGTDTPVPKMLPGFAVHRELEAFVRAGLTPYEALVTGTRNVAAYFGRQDSVGTVTVGKRADLVLLGGNPLKDVGQTRAVVGVMLNGRWLDQAELTRGLAALEGTLWTWPF